MNRFNHISLLLTFIFWLSCQTCSFASPDPELSAWVVRWHMDTPKKIQSICSETNANFNSLLVQVRGRADAYYNSDLAPRAEELDTSPAAFDPLASILEECRGRHIQAWMNVYYLWTGDTLPKNGSHPAQHHNSWILRDNSGIKVSQYSEVELAQNWVEGIYADPASDEYRKLFVDIVHEVASRYPIQGVHLDFVRYPGSHFGFATELAAEYKRAWGIDPRLLPEKITSDDLKNWYMGNMGQTDQLLITGALIWAEMRARAVTELVKKVKENLERVGKKQTLSAAIFPDYLQAYLDKGQDWLTWAEEGLIDALYPMAYFGEQERVLKQIEEVANTTNGSAPIFAGLGAYIKKPKEIAKEVQSISHIPLQGISFFSLGHIMKKKGGALPYIHAVSNNSDFKGEEQGDVIDSKIDFVKIIKEFKMILSHSDLNKALPSSALTHKFSQFSEACEKLFPVALRSLEKEKKQATDWVEMHGIFRYVHPYDTEKKKSEQKKLCNDARLKMLQGISMGKISKQFSQAGSRHFQSLLPRYYLTRDREKDQKIADLMPGEVSPVFEVENGYWCYKIIARGQEKTDFFSETSWPARRILFRGKLATMSPASQL